MNQSPLAPPPPPPPCAQGGLGEECERELEREEEEEEEVERELPRLEPVDEPDWDHAAALRARCLADLESCAGLQLVPLRRAAEILLHPGSLAALAWSPRVYCTLNYAATVSLPTDAPFNDFLRPVGELLLLPACGAADGGGSGAKPAAAAVLLSEREANGLLAAAYGSGGGGGTKGSGSDGPLLVDAAYAWAAQPQVGAAAGPADPLRLAASLARGGALHADGQLAAQLSAGGLLPQLVSARLFDGAATYVPPAQLAGMRWEAQRELAPLAELRKLVAGRGAAAEALVGARGKQVLYSHSQLERATDPRRHGGDDGGAA